MTTYQLDKDTFPPSRTGKEIIQFRNTGHRLGCDTL